MAAVVLGFDPGGAGQFGWCIATESVGGRSELQYYGTSDHAAGAVDMALNKAQEFGPIEAAAIDSPLFWVPGGDRKADRTVRDAMRRVGAVNVGGTVQHVNSLRGACLAQGLMTAHILRERLPNIRITESHPKALLWLLKIATVQLQVIKVTLNDLAEFIQCDAMELCEHERDAAMGTVAAWAMLNPQSGWRNLFNDEKEPFTPVSHVEYWMPTSLV